MSQLFLPTPPSRVYLLGGVFEFFYTFKQELLTNNFIIHVIWKFMNIVFILAYSLDNFHFFICL